MSPATVDGLGRYMQTNADSLECYWQANIHNTRRQTLKEIRKILDTGVKPLAMLAKIVIVVKASGGAA